MEQYFATANILKSSVPEFLSIYAKQADGEKQIASYVNKLLNSAKTRHRGLTILYEALPNFSSSAISEYAVTWVKYCIVLHSGDALKEIKLAVLSRLLFFANSNHDFDKNFLSDHLSKVLEMCLESSSNHNQMENALDCLAACLKSYPNWFNPHVKKIETFLLKFLDHASEDVVKKAAVAFHNLQQSGGGGLNKINYINNFTTSFHKLCETINLLMGNLVEDFTEINDSSKIETTPYELLPLRDIASSVDAYHKNSQRLINCLTYLKIMLQKQFLATKIIKPKIILDIISKGMALHLCVSQGTVPHEDWHRSEMLKKIQTHLLYLLLSLLSWLKTNAFPFSYDISKILVDSLVRSDKCDCFKLNRLYYETLHHVFVQWISVIRTIHPSFQTRIFSILIKNITPVSSKVSLNLDTNVTKAKSKKSKRKAFEEKIIASGNETSGMQKLNTQSRIMLESNTETSLRTIRNILAVAAEINRDILQRLYKITMSVALDIQAGRCTDPYNNIQCQIELFKVLIAFLEQEHASNLISVYPITRVLNNGGKNHNREISISCELGLRILEKICQPVCPYLTVSTTDNAQEYSDGILQVHHSLDEKINLFEPIQTDSDLELAEEPMNLDKEIGVEKNSPSKVKILDIQTITAPIVQEVVIEDSGKEIPMQIDEVAQPIQIDSESDEDVEFLDEQIVISDKETEIKSIPNGDCRNEVISLVEDPKDDISCNGGSNVDSEDRVIETVNKLVTEESEAVVGEAVEAKLKIEEPRGEQDDDMLDSFVDEVVEY